ncbi:unnamed protein product [Plasmodium vivax]|uniref:(malaria parasite P. vivax) hypothetical protein n=1 Tax=Plasmodium vivax TaxID=5855 RepID=A0A8S4H3I4_PLAVI|nr:unnamed protein product [Plasmodium vivax]
MMEKSIFNYVDEFTEFESKIKEVTNATQYEKNCGKFENFNDCKLYMEDIDSKQYQKIADLVQMYADYYGFKNESKTNGNNESMSFAFLISYKFTPLGAWLLPRLPGGKKEPNKIYREMNEWKGTTELQGSQYKVPYHSS